MKSIPKNKNRMGQKYRIPLKYPILLLLLCSLLFSLFSCQNEQNKAPQTTSIPDQIDFNFHVKPILSDRCFKCHGPDPNTREGGLRLDTKEGAFGNIERQYAILPNDVENSTLIQRVFSENPEDIMPPPESNLTLTEEEKAILKKWIEQGAEWKEHWSFLPINEPTIPQVKNAHFTDNQIDRFILSKLEANNLQPSERATKEQLIRRLSFDLRGLPPTLEELNSFLKDTSENAYEKLIDQFLDSDAYAENSATYWLDLARYADTHGYQDDLERIAWPWRDWVIHAFQKNMPFDQFVEWQLAGDLLPNATREQIIATAFNRNHKITQEGGVIPEEYRVEYVADRAQTFSTAFMGLTMECARCHDHKYDPLLQKDYFSLFSFFNNVPEVGLIEEYGAIPEPYITLTQEEIDAKLTFVNNLDTLPEIPLMVMQEMPEPRQAYILNRGAYDQSTTPVNAETPAAILPFDTTAFARNRLGLSQWLFSPDNPLTARVTVNRLWQQCFGKGIVNTPYDFGNQGALPTHPELLDHLALKLSENWDIKATLKYIVSSATYQQSAKVTPELLELDPENELYARAPRRRLSAEMIRDQALAVSGLLNRTVGGPSVKPYQPPGLWQETTGGGGGSTAKYIEDEGEKLYRRSLYTFWKRTVPPPNMMTFDAASRDLCTVERQSTSTPLQALVLLNDPQIIEASRVLAYRAIDLKNTPKERIAYLFRATTSRQILEEELVQLIAYFEAEKVRFKQDVEAANAYLSIGNYPQQEDLNPSLTAAYAVVANAIFNLDETISR